jgi:hypothetical protein
MVLELRRTKPMDGEAWMGLGEGRTALDIATACVTHLIILLSFDLLTYFLKQFGILLDCSMFSVSLWCVHVCVCVCVCEVAYFLGLV